MDLARLLNGLPAQVSGPTAREITSLSLDSRQVTPGGIYVAIVGTRADGHKFVADAVARGASAVVVSRPVSLPTEVTCIRVEDTREILTHLSSRFFGAPSAALTLIGLTGTNGKTTCCYLLESILEAAGRKPGVVGTINYRFMGRRLPAPNTTPDLVVFQRLLSEMRDAGVESVVAEVSSHALVQKRVDGLNFDAVMFTNLSRDHLDYHASFEAYFEAKARLFHEVIGASDKADTLAVVNLDDPYGRRLSQEARANRLMGFSRHAESDAPVRLLDAELNLDGITARIETPAGRIELTSCLLGDFNLENILGCVALALGLGIPTEDIRQGISACTEVPGRTEEIRNSRGIKVLVDYAHTDDALHRVLAALRPLTRGRLITVFGCGGERDRGKRPLMAEAAVEYSDLSVVTSDNPRGESPEAIIADVLPGLEQKARRRDGTKPIEVGHPLYQVEVDRRKAIQLAVASAQPGDLVLIAGKGHEPYQRIGDQTLHFDDREEAALALSHMEVN